MPPRKTPSSRHRLNAILERFGSERHSLLRVGRPQAGIEFVALGKINGVETLAASTNAAVDRLQAYFDGQLDKAFPGLKIYFGDGLTESGGEALASENAIIIDATKGKMTIAEAEEVVVGAGAAKAGDWTKVVDPATPSAEVTIVHEFGHLLEAKAHGAEGVAFVDLPPSGAPTKYGREAGGKAGPNNEDYPESFAYDVYGADIGEARRAILRQDARHIAGHGQFD